jgi:hypothetical protein
MEGCKFFIWMIRKQCTAVPYGMVFLVHLMVINEIMGARYGELMEIYLFKCCNN